MIIIISGENCCGTSYFCGNRDSGLFDNWKHFFIIIFYNKHLLAPNLWRLVYMGEENYYHYIVIASTTKLHQSNNRQWFP